MVIPKNSIGVNKNAIIRTCVGDFISGPRFWAYLSLVRGDVIKMIRLGEYSGNELDRCDLSYGFVWARDAQYSQFNIRLIL